MDELDHEAFQHFLERNSLLLDHVLEDVESHPDARYIAGCEVFEGLQCVTFCKDADADDLNAMWVNAPGATFFAQRVMWTNLPEPAPTKDSWLVTVVIPDKPSIFFAKNVDDQLWDALAAVNAPWFAVSTAGAMRRAASEGQPLPPLRTADNEALFLTPSDNPEPPVNEEGVVG